MSIRNGIRSGIAAVIGAAVLVVTPAISRAQSPADWAICPAIDTEPVCDLVVHADSNGAGGRPVTVQRSAPRNTADVYIDISCTSRPVLWIVACAE